MAYDMFSYYGLFDNNILMIFRNISQTTFQYMQARLMNSFALYKI